MQLDLRSGVLPSKVPGREFCQPNMGGAYFGRYRGVAILSMNADDAHRRAGALFKKEQQLREAQQAMAEYQAELQATRKRLRGCGRCGWRATPPIRARRPPIRRARRDWAAPRKDRGHRALRWRTLGPRGVRREFDRRRRNRPGSLNARRLKGA